MTRYNCVNINDSVFVEFLQNMFFPLQAIMDNGPARKVQTAQKMQEAGDVSGDMFEISTIRREVGVWEEWGSSRGGRGGRSAGGRGVCREGQEAGAQGVQPVKYRQLRRCRRQGMSRGICLRSPPLGERCVSGRTGCLAGV